MQLGIVIARPQSSGRPKARPPDLARIPDPARMTQEALGLGFGHSRRNRSATQPNGRGRRGFSSIRNRIRFGSGDG